MSRDQPTSDPGRSILTTVLISNLHCPSCVSNIKESLSLLDPKPISVSTSIVSQTVVIRHKASLVLATIIRALQETGFDVESATQNPPRDTLGGDDETVDNLEGPSASDAPKRWRSIGKHQKDGKENQIATHIERCDMCRAEKLAGTDPKTIKPPIPGYLEQPPQQEEHRTHAVAGLEDEPLTIVIPSNLATDSVRASLSISGMTCSSCVGKVTKALQTKGWIRSVDVNLLTSSANVTFYGREHIKDILDAIKDAGYEATVDGCEDVPDSGGSGSSPPSDKWRASYAVGGMTCSSCVVTITKALVKFAWVRAVDVNLVLNSASVLFEGRSHLGKIAETIGELGYETKLSGVESAGPAREGELEREVVMRVDGMHCDHCPSRVMDAVRAYGDRVRIEQPLTRVGPLLKLTYTPSAPEFTIRHILGSISAVDASFQVSIYHPPTLEERSRKMHARQRRRLLRRLVLAVIIAIPTFIIGVVLKSLVPSDSTGRRYIMRPVWSGQASRYEWALFIMATPVYFLAADLFHRRTIKEIWLLWRPGSKTPILQRLYRFGSMDMLMSLGISIAYFSSIAVLGIDARQPPGSGSIGDSSSYFDAAVFLTMFLLTGRLIEAYCKSRAGDAVTMLGKLRPTQAVLVETTDGSASGGNLRPDRPTRTIQIDLLEYGDVVRVSHGGSPPYDGVIIEGESKFDESSLTGESRLVGKSIGDEVFSGTVNKGGPISVRISRVSGNSMLDQIVAAVREGQTRRAPIERLADVITGYFVPIVTLIAVSVWVIWLGLGVSGALPDAYLNNRVGGWPFWSLQFAIAVFVIACPCGIGLAAPTALFVGGGLAAQHGILVKGGGEAFQEASHLDCVVFDKTGTLTKGGEPAITDHEFLSGVDQRIVAGTIRRLEESSSHPMAKAVVSFCDARGIQAVRPLKIEEVAGKGMSGSFLVDGAEEQEIEVLIGNEALMLDHNVDIPEANTVTLDTWKGQGKSVALVATRDVQSRSSIAETTLIATTNWNLSAMLAAADPLRPEAGGVIQALKDRSVDVWMISGDNPITAYAVGEMVGIPKSNIIAGVLPDQKSEKIRYLQRSLHKSNDQSPFWKRRERIPKRAIIAMVGDGINDSPALTAADVGIAIGSGSDIAISSAEFVLISSGLTSLLTLIDRTVFTRIKFNFGWALVYNMIALPLAAGVLYPIKSNGSHVRLDPVWASVAMALSSVSVVCSSLLLRTRLPVVGFRLDKKDPKNGFRAFIDYLISKVSVWFFIYFQFRRPRS